MKNACLAIVIALTCALSASAQDSPKASNPITSIFVARTGIRIDAPHVGTYHYAEFFQLHGKLLWPDVGIVDYGHDNYRELFAGAGGTIYSNKKAFVVEELYFAQATGDGAKSARYLWPWTLINYHFAPKLTADVVYFPYIPLNQSARVQNVVEHAKIDYTVNKTINVGGGYGAYKYGDGDWQNKPFVTTTVSTRGGSFEFWLQKMPGGAQVQLRYKLARTSAR